MQTYKTPNTVLEERDIILNRNGRLFSFRKSEPHLNLYISANINISNLAKTWALIPPYRIVDTGIQSQTDTRSFRSFA